MSLRNEPTLVEAVRSVIEQEPPVEVVVVNSGGGGAEATLRAAGIQAPVVEREEPLLPGAVRNLGIAATRAPFVAFLAADCLAEPGWAAGRLRRHEAGALLVASSLVNANYGSRSANASYLLLFHRRMPTARLGHRGLYGVSYSRELLERLGPFREDLRVAEDTELHSRLGDLVPIAWAPDVRTAHRHPIGVREMVADQYSRGRRLARGLVQVDGPSRRRVAVSAMRNVASAMWWSWRTTRGEARRRFVRCWPLLPAGAAAYVLGLVRGPPR